MLIMKIAHFLNHAHQANGHVELTVDLSCEQAKEHDVSFASGQNNFKEILKNNGVEVCELEYERNILGVLKLTSGMYKFLSKNRPDIVHAHMVISAVVAKILKPFFGYQLITTLHNSFDSQFRLMSVGDRCICVSEAVSKEAISKGFSRSKVRVVLNGAVGGKRRAPQPTEIRKLKHPSIAFVGGLHERKGVIDLLEAFVAVNRTCGEAYLYIVGSGPQEEELQLFCQKNDIEEYVSFLGHLTDPRTILGDTDIFVCPSHQEPFGLVIGEARQMGCAIVASNVGGIPEAMGGKERGILVSPQSPADLSASICRLIEDPSMRKKYQSAALTDLEDISVSKMCEGTISVYREVLKTPNSAS